MIKIKAIYGKYKDLKYENSVDTIEDAIKSDYRFWYHYKEQLDFYYNGIKLERLSDDCEFDEEIENLKEQIVNIIKQLETGKEDNKYEN